MSVAFDTLKFARALREKASMSAEQAEGVAEAFSDATSEQLATKADLDKLGADLRAEINGVKTALQSEINGVKMALQSEINGVKTALQSEINGVKTEGASLRGEIVLLKWMTGFLLALMLAVFAKLFLR